MHARPESLPANSYHSLTSRLWRVVGALALTLAGGLAGLPAHALIELTDISKIAAGRVHTCALTSTGAVKCWGDNGAGQLGDNSTTGRSTPVDVPGLSSGVVAIATGNAHTCALTTAGGVKCWGSNSQGQLGDNSTTGRTTPVDVSGLSSGVTAIATGGYHTCALTTGGGVKCWGNNPYGQLGDNSTTNRSVPVDVLGLASGVAAITTGGDHTCALTTTGGAKCWGSNDAGQVGDNSATNRLAPVDVSGLASGVTAIAAGGSRFLGGHTCALTATGGVKCWGSNFSGELGDNSTIARLTPVDVSGLSSGVAAIAVGGLHSCALTTAGGIKCWGRNFEGQLGDNSTTNRSAPIDVSSLMSGLAVIAAGERHTCALTTVGGMKCWGDNYYSQLGDASTLYRLTPVDVSGLASGVTAITAGLGLELFSFSYDAMHTCALTTAGGVKCWGWNGNGQLGDNSTADRSMPVEVSGLTSGVAAIATGSRHTCALTTAGGVKCWGNNSYGQLGDNSVATRLTPVDVSGLSSGVAAIATGGFHTCALTTLGGVKCWGNNNFGVLGDNSTTHRSTPVDVSGFASGIAAIAAGNYHTCALTTVGGVKCLGSNAQGQLGDNSTTHRSTPVDVLGLASGVATIVAGNLHTCALTSAGGVKCWGYNIHGQLGDNSAIGRLTPVDVSGLASGVATITAGNLHTCALNTVGGMKCWGNNDAGQLGDNSTANRLTPVEVSGLASGLAAITAGGRHTCALTTAGGVKCWGYNLKGQVGDGTSGIRPYPAPVLTFDTVPDAFIFTAQTSVPLSTLLTSNSVTITGLEANAPILVSNGGYSLGCTATFVSTAGMIPPGQSVCVRHTSAVSLATTVTTTLTIGGVAGTFTSTTQANPSAPGAPIIGSTAVGSAQTVVTFTAPASDGGSAITGYTVTCTAADQITRTSSGPASPITVGGLTSGVVYSCTVTAQNSIGSSTPSAPVMVKTVFDLSAILMMLLFD